MSIRKIILVGLATLITSSAQAGLTESEAMAFVAGFREAVGPWYRSVRESEIAIRLRLRPTTVADTFGGPRIQGEASSETSSRMTIDLVTTPYGLETVSKEGLFGLLCHEAGHHLGGEPNYSGRKAPGGVSLSVEGQADFWAGSVCIPGLFDRLLSGSGSTEANFTGVAIEFLETLGFSEKKIGGDPGTDFPGILEQHPNGPCRFRTLLAGIQGRERPRCWYNP